MADQSLRGRFVWHELMTPDTTGAHSFYAKALGWKIQNWDQDPSYSMFVAGSGPLGSSVEQPNGASHWLPYVGAADLSATVKQARRLGGKVLREPTDMPGGSTFALLRDPQGASFGVYASRDEHSPESAPKHGEFSWHELATTDNRAAFDFYSFLFGWELLHQHEMGSMGVYLIFGRNGVQKGGMFNKPSEMPGGPSWLGYIRVKDLSQTVNKVTSARGTLVNGPMEVPGGDWIAQFVDPYGAMFAAQALSSDISPTRAKKKARRTTREHKKTVSDESGNREAASVYVSYAWEDESSKLVDEIQRRLPPQLVLVRDKDALQPGDRISRFMRRIGRSQLVVVVLSEKYLRSVYCMRELLYLHNSSLGEPHAVLGKLVPLISGNLRISRPVERLEYVRYWKREHDDLELALRELDLASVGSEDRDELLVMKDIQHRISDLLAWIADVLMPRGELLHGAGIDTVIRLLIERTKVDLDPRIT